MIAKRRLGVLHVNAEPVQEGEFYKDVISTISIKDASPGEGIHWNMVNGKLIAERVILCGVSWDILDNNGLIFGKEVVINGLPYLLRSLKVGGQQYQPNEWQDILNEAGDEDSIWHWKSSYFWGQEMDEDREEERLRSWSEEERLSQKPYRIYIGGTEANAWHSYCSFYRDRNIGFRPVLEPICPVVNDALINKELIVWSSSGNAIRGKLIEFTPYDLVLSDSLQVAFDGVGINNFAERRVGPQRIFIINRSQVNIVQAYQN